MSCSSASIPFCQGAFVRAKQYFKFKNLKPWDQLCTAAGESNAVFPTGDFLSSIPAPLTHSCQNKDSAPLSKQSIKGCSCLIQVPYYQYGSVRK